ncbi:ATP-binding protein [Actinomadura macrotermitis]|uniref:Histidine kinase/HSP90-like ATPase domain-containing protein n=1 Tax=Actinomadura macrotermitis TaxID=2585200 RepID=A0A7K0C139_9ACTN|nr:ATP-binding protein [Actinomadura macrotermitis]MQY07185.1 hypothetical protein [Actinomadura macrotermitis]
MIRASGGPPSAEAGRSGSSAIMLPAEAGAIKKARDFTTEGCERHGMDTFTAVLVVSELATHALHHGTAAGEPIILRLYISDHGPVVEVWDRGDGHPYALPPDPSRENGRGMAIVGELALRWGVNVLEGGGKCVYAVLRAEAS